MNQPLRDHVDLIESELSALGTPQRAEHEKRYLKSTLTFHGTPVPAIARYAKATIKAAPAMDHAAVTSLAQELWSRPVHELHMFAIDLLELRNVVLTADDVPMLEHMLRTSYTWAYVDSLAASVVGPILERDPDLLVTLDRWSTDEDFWMRRSAMLALLRPLRQGRGEIDRFLGYADSMLDEKEFFIRKAIGWVLRETARKRPDVVREFLSMHMDRVAGLTLREAVRHLPEQDRDSVMAAYRTR